MSSDTAILVVCSYGENQGPTTCPTMPGKSTVMVAEVLWSGQASCWMVAHPFISLKEAQWLLERYRDEVLEPYVCLFRSAVGPKFNLMDNNARPHRALLVDEFLESEDIRDMYWLSSLQTSILEHVWDALGRAIESRNPPPRIIQCLKLRCWKSGTNCHGNS